MKIKIGNDITIEASPDLIMKAHKVIAVLKDTKKVEIEYNGRMIRCWMVDHGSGKPSLNIQVLESS